MTRKQTEKNISEIKEELVRLEGEIQKLEQETGTLDYSSPVKAVLRLEEIQSSLYAKNSAVKALNKQLRIEEKNLQAQIKEEVKAKVSALREREKTETMKVIQELENLQLVFQGMNEVEEEIRLLGVTPGMNINFHLKPIIEMVNPAMRNMKSFFPEYFGLPGKPTRKERQLKSA